MNGAKTILVTGGAGFIGSNFIRYILNKHKNYRIINLDKLTYAGNLDNLKEVENDPRYTFVKGDICDRPLVEKTLLGCDACINFAAESHVDRSITGPDPFITTGVLGTFTLLEVARKGDIAYMQISTDEVYGSLQKGYFKETDILNPSSPYSASKASADLLVRSYYITYGLPVFITRSSNNYGPNQYPEKLIPRFTINALRDKPLPVYGTGTNVRDWIYVLDNCAAIDKVLDKGKVGEIYNIASKCGKNNVQVIKTLLDILSIDRFQIVHTKDRPGHDRRYSLSTAKIKRHLNWKPRVSFIAGIKKTVKWYCQNKKWLENTQTGTYRSFYKKYYSKLGLKQI